MIDPRTLRSAPEALRKAMTDRGGRYSPMLEELLGTDGAFRKAQAEVEAQRAQQNALSKEIGKLKAQKADASEVLKKADAAKAAMAQAEAQIKELEPKHQELLLSLPNPPDASVPVGKTPEDNPVVREKAANKPKFEYKPLDHHEIGERLGILDFAAAGKISGARFAVLKGAGAALERALISFMLDLHIKEHGYTEIFPPFLVTAQTLTGTGQLPKFEGDLFKTNHERGLYLIPTAEVPVTNLHAEEILDPARLPLKYCAYTACFRSEAGTYGKDTRGLIRQHQFNKVELVWITRPQESMAALETLTANAETVLERLGLAHRVIHLCTGDMGFASAKTYDLEVWMAGEGRYREISSCSNCTDFQARRMKTRLKAEKGTELVHTLNGSGVAVGRAFAAILEHYQQPDGSVVVPEVLRPYMGIDRITKR